MTPQTPIPELDALPLPEPAPSSNLPRWDDCCQRVANSDFIAKRVAAGGYGPDRDSKTANHLHRFIYEYDDQDAYRSGWFRHRLELAIEEARREGYELAMSKRADEYRRAGDRTGSPRSLRGQESGA